MAKETKSKRPLRDILKRNAIIAALVLFVGYAGVHIISRTDGFRSLVADKIGSGTRLPVALEHCGMTPLLRLELKNLDFYGVRMPRVKITFDWFAWLSKQRPLVKRLEVEGLEVEFRQTPGGKWEPLVMHDLGARFGAVVGLPQKPAAGEDELPKFPPFVINDKTLLDLDRARVTWYDAQNRELAYVTDVDSQVRIARLGRHKTLQVDMKCSHIQLASGQLLRDVELETVRIEGYVPVLVLKLADSDGEYQGFSSESLWQDLYRHLSRLSEL